MSGICVWRDEISPKAAQHGSGSEKGGADPANGDQSPILVAEADPARAALIRRAIETVDCSRMGARFVSRKTPGVAVKSSMLGDAQQAIDLLSIFLTQSVRRPFLPPNVLQIPSQGRP